MGGEHVAGPRRDPLIASNKTIAGRQLFIMDLASWKIHNAVLMAGSLQGIALIRRYATSLCWGLGEIPLVIDDPTVKLISVGSQLQLWMLWERQLYTRRCTCSCLFCLTIVLIHVIRILEATAYMGLKYPDTVFRLNTCQYFPISKHPHSWWCLFFHNSVCQ